MHCERLENIPLLRHPPYATTTQGIDAFEGGPSLNLLAIQGNLTRVQTRDPHQGVDERGFTHPISAKQGQGLPFTDRERNIGQNDRLSITRHDPIDLQDFIQARLPQWLRRPSRLL